MKTSATLALATLFGSASAFSPSARTASTSALQMSELDGMLGVSVETGNKVYDPLELNQWVPAKWARETEIANGRSAMLATVGWFWPQIFGTFDSQDVTTTDPIDAIMQADPQWWAQFIVLCGTFEAYKYKKGLEGKSSCGPGTPVVDYMKGYPEDEEARNTMHMRELKNGRLAMIGVASFISAHFIPGSVPALPVGFH
mmetsp:Transcript_28582/g.42259  ORF Transcript_28582/g.42259 Transcript_28582/m.42259 type:complete len:199 (-) Transcript_28582:325-921(-)|eukprot:CAMPEP_0195519294 /NCGR_PEP_ID=MMETSP0794_2-20130614/14563_1 /TAXON_ID=515487 /ORGANISM="Stephanopyxis turris, Strain CCMP 815" /LENGTH=198 /DNA_ID=CAMNT_0040648419 /DNA_START=53 /DNA_END=649 /DNA_ORIENTATION=+